MVRLSNHEREAGVAVSLASPLHTSPSPVCYGGPVNVLITLVHRHRWRPLGKGHRPGGSDDDPEVDGEFEVCLRCHQVRQVRGVKGSAARGS